MTGHWREGPHGPGTESAIHAWLPPRSTGHQRSARRRACRSVQPGSLNPSQQPEAGSTAIRLRLLSRKNLGCCSCGGTKSVLNVVPGQPELRSNHIDRLTRSPAGMVPVPRYRAPGRRFCWHSYAMTPIDANSLIGAGLGRAGPTSARGLRRTAGRSAPGWSATARCAPRHRLSSAVYRLRGRAGGRGQRAELRPGRGPGAVSADRWRPAG
jgi:hypothetical protein